jgi:hypothetical protein
MKLLKRLIGIICSVTIFTACQKDYTPDLGSASGAGTGTTNNSSTDYFPTTANSYWSYTFDITGDSVLVTATSSNASIKGVTYRVFKGTDGSGSFDSSYYRKDNSGSYYEFGDIDYAGALDSIGEYIDYAFLKDNVALNTTWESGEVNAKLNNVTGKAKAKFTIAGKDIQQTINGVAVDNVIQVKRETLFKPASGSTFSTAGSVNAFYAKNKGMLLVTGTLMLPPLPPVPFKLEAKRYKIF